MRKRVHVLLLATAAFGLVLAAAAAAAPSTEVSGTWEWTSRIAVEDLPDGGKRIFGSEDSRWFGALDGTSLDVFDGLFRKDGGAICAITTFFTGKVLGRAGSMIVDITVYADQDATPLEGGRWVIRDAARGLKGLHGEGEWTYTGPDNKATYSGRVYWE